MSLRPRRWAAHGMVNMLSVLTRTCSLFYFWWVYNIVCNVLALIAFRLTPPTATAATAGLPGRFQHHWHCMSCCQAPGNFGTGRGEESEGSWKWPKQLLLYQDHDSTTRRTGTIQTSKLFIQFAPRVLFLFVSLSLNSLAFLFVLSVGHAARWASRSRKALWDGLRQRQQRAFPSAKHVSRSNATKMREKKIRAILGKKIGQTFKRRQEGCKGVPFAERVVESRKACTLDVGNF